MSRVWRYPSIVLVLVGMCALQIGAGESALQLNDSLYLGKPVSVENLTVWPVFSSKPQPDVGDFLTLAQAGELAVVREMGAGANGGIPQPAQPAAAQAGQQPARQSVQEPAQQRVQQREQQQGGQQVLQVDAGAQVNQLVIENKSDKPIFVLAGTLVKGGKQDRQIAQDFIIPPKQTVPVDAFCVEHGRWTADREGKQTDGIFQAQTVLAVKEVRASGQYKMDQQEVWNKVATNNAKASKAPQTGTLLSVVDETDKDALERRKRLLKAVEDHFAALASSGEAPVGLAYAVDGKVREIRTFAHSKILAMYRETLINTAVLEADLSQREAKAGKKEIYSKTADAMQCAELVKNAEKLKEENVDTKAGNQNGYRKDSKVWNGNVYVNAAPGTAPGKSAPVSQSFQPAE